MNTIQAPGSFSFCEGPPCNPISDKDFMSDDGPTTEKSQLTGLDGHKDARSLIRLIQCSFCSYPLRTPVTLPCGNSLCRQCLPPPHLRQYISYPATISRQSGITCPFADCHQDHSLEDCSVNVVLLKIMESISNEVARDRAIAGAKQTTVEEIMLWPSESTDSNAELPEKGRTRILHGGRLVSTFTFAEMGELHYTSDVRFVTTPGDAEEDPAVDTEALDRWKEASHKELDCHVCYSLMLDPITTPCGHTFCRQCLARILDHASLCAICRRDLPEPSSLVHHPSNKYLVDLLSSLCPDQVIARKEAVALEECSAPGGLDTPLFPCAVSFPEIPFFLHIFEPRYRLMIRRAVQSNGRFGMVGYNARGLPQGSLGRTQFMEVGTLLQIEQYQITPDGRSWLQCKGLSRFKVQAHGILDGYTVAKVQKHEDISLAEEERIEARETSAPPAPPNDLLGQIDRLSTQQLLEICTSFVARARQQSMPWLQGRILEAYGEPPTDPASFPYWFASVLPLSDEEKYKLLPTSSVRERLKMTAKWVHRIQGQRWYVSASPPSP